MKNFARCVAMLFVLGLGGGVAAAAEAVPANTTPPRDGTCLHHTLADKNIIVKLANGEKYDDRLPKKEAGPANTTRVTMPMHTFLCKDGRITMLQ